MTDIVQTERETTLQRLLQAAVEVFAERGYRAATVREICRRADVNGASVNYYFRSKDALYAEALKFAFRDAQQRHPQRQALDAQLPAPERLRCFIENFLQILLDDSHLGLHGRLIVREITEPTRALDSVIEFAIRPRCLLLNDIVRTIAGPSAAQETVDRCVVSILGQCLMYKFSRAVLCRVFPHLLSGSDPVGETGGHIARFSLDAIAGLTRERPE